MKKQAETLAQAIEEAIQSRDLSARVASLKAGLSESAIKHILRGTSGSPKVDTLARIAHSNNIPFFVSFDAHGFIPGDMERDGSHLVPSPNTSAQTLDNAEEAAWLGLWRDMNEKQRRMALALIQAAIDTDAA
ncbi:helix-turn-helix domain-containing protein [Acetobacter oryzoeni]|uniref:Helix-turn-helix transcriptional regulator n=1 Tax=Acetobacter oryzoeni TaxID=2500548 RepID=A0A5B9GNV3_9PROT|nr:helix-turn-helix transcriptional regulator [Acetobacter oryzoeni]MCP1202286.1 helix-turn-helix domain-containing protein [Acetobacter oryzoeni]QEE86010.1 helix-turn-helix transcriptional regulator [Acetobacter oryzoeni]